MNKKLLFVYNPHSGKQAVSRKLSAIVDIFAADGYDVTCHPTQARLDCMETVSEQAGLYDMVVVSGGDGTLNEAVNGYMQAGCTKPMGYIPFGSTNDFSHSTGIPIQPLKAAQTVIDGEPMLCDLGCFNGRYFTYVAGFGTLAEVSYSTPQDIKNALGFSAYILEGLSALTTIESFNLSYEADERSGEGEYLLGLVTNTLHVAGFKNIVSSNVLLNDGLFEVLLVKKPKTASDLQKIASSILSRNFDNECIESFKTAKITVTAKDKPLSVDAGRRKRRRTPCLADRNSRARIKYYDKETKVIMSAKANSAAADNFLRFSPV